jgi:hypothetical protein
MTGHRRRRYQPGRLTVLPGGAVLPGGTHLPGGTVLAGGTHLPVGPVLRGSIARFLAVLRPVDGLLHLFVPHAGAGHLLRHGSQYLLAGEPAPQDLAVVGHHRQPVAATAD